MNPARLHPSTAAAKAEVRHAMIAVLLSATVLPGYSLARNPDVPDRQAGPAADIVVQPDLTYAVAEGKELKLDLARPATGNGPFPAVVCLHGGGFVSGNRKDLTVIRELARRGYVAVSVDYRLAPAHRFPAQVHDAKAAVRWLRANADRYGVDPERIGALGYSAGGTLACLLGSTGAPFSQVRVVVSYYGLADLKAFYECKVRGGPAILRLGFQFVAEGLLGGPPEEHADGYALASPMTHAGRGSAPTLLLHGDTDWKVPVEQSRLYARKLQGAGGRVELVELAGVGHDFGFERGPHRDRADAAAFAFLDRELKPAAAVVVTHRVDRPQEGPRDAR